MLIKFANNYLDAKITFLCEIAIDLLDMKCVLVLLYIVKYYLCPII